MKRLLLLSREMNGRLLVNCGIHWELIDSGSPQYSHTFRNILYDFSNAFIWMFHQFQAFWLDILESITEIQQRLTYGYPISLNFGNEDL